LADGVLRPIQARPRVFPEGVTAWRPSTRSTRSTGRDSSPSSPRHPTYQDALIVDAQTGAVTAYLGSGLRSCDAEPTLYQALALYSVPFEERTTGSSVVALPPCGHLFKISRGPYDKGLRDGEVEMIAEVPLGPCHAAPTTQVVRLDYQAPIIHAPVRQLLSQASIADR